MMMSDEVILKHAEKEIIESLDRLFAGGIAQPLRFISDAVTTVLYLDSELKSANKDDAWSGITDEYRDDLLVQSTTLMADLAAVYEHYEWRKRFLEQKGGES